MGSSMRMSEVGCPSVQAGLFPKQRQTLGPGPDGGVLDGQVDVRFWHQIQGGIESMLEVAQKRGPTDRKGGVLKVDLLIPACQSQRWVLVVGVIPRMLPNLPPNGSEGASGNVVSKFAWLPRPTRVHLLSSVGFGDGVLVGERVSIQHFLRQGLPERREQDIIDPQLGLRFGEGRRSSSPNGHLRKQDPDIVTPSSIIWTGSETERLATLGSNAVERHLDVSRIVFEIGRVPGERQTASESL